jgi:hypothetical protein
MNIPGFAEREKDVTASFACVPLAVSCIKRQYIDTQEKGGHSMATLQVRSVDDRLYKALGRIAEQGRISNRWH